MPRINRLAAATAIAAAFSMIAAPLAAVELPRPHGPASAQAWDEDANTAENRRWRRHRDGIDGGDILAGVLIIGGIAAVASAIENNKREERYDYPPPPRDDYEYRGDYRSSGPGGSGLGRAADICADAIERTLDPVGSIDGVRRGPAGWDVEGTLSDGSPFACTIGNDGEITDIRTDRAYSGATYDEPAYGEELYVDRPYEEGQYDDRTYSRLREGLGG